MRLDFSGIFFCSSLFRAEHLRILLSGGVVYKKTVGSIGLSVERFLEWIVSIVRLPSAFVLLFVILSVWRVNRKFGAEGFTD